MTFVPRFRCSPSYRLAPDSAGVGLHRIGAECIAVQDRALQSWPCEAERSRNDIASGRVEIRAETEATEPRMSRKLIPFALLSAMLLGTTMAQAAGGGGGGGGAGGAGAAAAGAAGAASSGATSGSSSSTSTGSSTTGQGRTGQYSTNPGAPTGQGNQGVTGQYSTNPGVPNPPPRTNPATGQQYDPNNPVDPNRPGSPMNPQNNPNASTGSSK